MNQVERTMRSDSVSKRALLGPSRQAEWRRRPAEIVNLESAQRVRGRLREMPQDERMDVMSRRECREKRQPRRYYLLAAARMQTAGHDDGDFHGRARLSSTNAR